MAVPPVSLDVGRTTPIHPLDPPFPPGNDIQQGTRLISQRIKTGIEAAYFPGQGRTGVNLPPVVQLCSNFCRNPGQFQNTAALFMYQKQYDHPR